jgi:hypothetical protein
MLCSVYSCRTTAPRQFDDTAVYSVLIDGLRARASREAVLLLEPNRTAFTLGGPLLERMPSETVARAFAAANREPSRLTEDHAAALGLELFEPRRFPLTDGNLNMRWQGIRSHYGGRPVTLLRLTRPGFSDDGRLAVVYYGTACGGLCGETRLAVLEIRNGGWRVRSDRIMLVS